MAKLSNSEKKNYFKPKELACRHTGDQGFNPEFLNTLNDIREECGFSFALSSAYRSQEHPIEARKEVKGAHGIQRIGIQQKGSGRFIHLDACTEEDGFPCPAIWSY